MTRCDLVTNRHSLHAVGNPVGRPTALFSGVITVGFLDQLRIGREQTDRPVAAAGAAANGKGVTGMRERYGVIAMAEAVMCPCCGRSMRAASTEAVLQAAGAGDPPDVSAERPL